MKKTDIIEIARTLGKDVKDPLIVLVEAYLLWKYDPDFKDELLLPLIRADLLRRTAKLLDVDPEKLKGVINAGLDSDALEHAKEPDGFNLRQVKQESG